MYDNLIRDAFVKAVGPALIMIFAVTASLSPLYLILKFQSNQLLLNEKEQAQVSLQFQRSRPIIHR